MNKTVLDITKDLIARESVTPEDANCQEIIKTLLSTVTSNSKAGFDFEQMDFEDTKNLWAITQKNDPSQLDEPVFLFAGHTDVVPAGNCDKWNTPPFVPTIIDGVLYGRGTADMKGSIAAMVHATNHFRTDYPHHKGQIAFLITSDEEGPFINGTVRVVEELIKRKQKIDYALVGEPSSTNTLGDVIKIGRRGSLTGWLKIHTTQGHVAYPHLAENAIHTASNFISAVTKMEWDQGNENFPPTSLQITDIKAGIAGNVIPGEIDLEFNFRFSTEYTAENLKAKMEAFISQHAQKFDLDWKINGEPFITTSTELIDATKKAIKETCNINTSAETSGGTSDGRFIAKIGAQIVELGPINKTIHQVNECVNVADLEKLSELYYQILKNLLVEESKANN